MENIRIWSKETKRSEAVWLGYLLTLCGCQVWMGRLIDDNLDKMGVDGEYQYVDILLFDTVDIYFCRKLAIMHPEGVFFVSGDGGQQVKMLWWEICPQLTLMDTSTLTRMMNRLCNYIVKDSDECEGVLRLTSAYVTQKSALARSMYTVRELFCSRRVNYDEYENKGLLLETITQMEGWYHEYAMLVHKRATFSESFAMTYIQNMIDEAYIKAHMRGGVETSIIMQNANYLLKRNPGCDAVRLLKLQILRNCTNYKEWPDDLLEKFVSRSAPEYRGRAYCEIGDISRENPNKMFDLTTEEYFEKANEKNLEEYCGLYKLGYLYGRRGSKAFPWLDEAEMKYTQVIEYISQISPEHRTPQEFEYYYKASYGKIKSQMEKDRVYGRLSAGKMLDYQEKLVNLARGTQSFRELVFWREFYGTGAKCEKVLFFMQEKMKNIEALINRLVRSGVNV